MNILKRFVTGLGQQTAPFGFAPNDPEAAYKAGLGYVGDVGANLMANNQGGVDPFANLGASLQQAKSQGIDRNKQAFAAQQMMEQAAENKRKREAEAARQQQMEEAISQLPPDRQALARMVPEKFFGAQVESMFGMPDLTTDMKNYRLAQEDPAYAEFLQQGRGGGAGKWGATVVPLRNRETGELVAGQFNQAQGGIFINGEPADPNTWEYAPGILEQEKASGRTEGKLVTEQNLSAPSDLSAAEDSLGVLDQIEKHPGLERGTGFSSYGNRIRGTIGYDFQNLVDQATSGAFLTAIEKLRGMGALSNTEGQAATAAVTRMDTATSKEAFLKALQDYREIVEAARDRALTRLQKRDFGPVSDEPPPGVTPKEWAEMTDEERAAWQ